ncbi:quaternary amine ABC transporter ATP-binding protein [Glaciimonas immobilis]|uniref:Quaternary amine transport ATP-binding protein n=1 Tax=Glaciimonas immobilis TaxID=728004 RepID=A0A840RSL9_9BURK|nr:betaine/proline/choline family ABC transporter ATP-binding protein [Glaciimonas immobilis]KAF3997097.1 betaine/proline/choline family ABC transporter ATP-binding protein [Glaciimonas immobilis]MBB5199956.1 glycine betaine/proline transport system ATP-binding protein [Glaciimonas immobilis]
MIKIEARQIVKIFGPREQEALKQLRNGKSKADILQQNDCNVGLDHVSLQIAAGQIFVIMGLSGSGKSTLVRHFNRLIDPTAGEIFVDGQNILTLNAAGLRDLRRRRISMVFQNFGLLPHQTVLENTAYGLLVRGDNRAASLATARDWIERVGLSGYENNYPDALSGGMRQRVGLARALAMDTDIVLMDEAFSALDPLIRSEMQAQLLDLQATLQKTIIFITHDLDEALRLGTRIAILRDGKLVQEGSPAEILKNPADDYVRRFVEKREVF